MRGILTSFFICCLLFQASAQDSLKLGENDIEYRSEKYLTFVDKLSALHLLDEGKVHILHIGDSHLQADMLTGAARKTLQESFGNAGRGLIFPYKLAETYGPKDFLATTNQKWQSSWIVHKTKLFEIGLPGIGAMSKDSNGGFNLNFRKDGYSNPYTNGFVLYKLLSPMESAVVRINGEEMKALHNEGFSKIEFNRNQATEDFSFDFSGGKMNLHTLFFENNQRGLIYSSFGVTSARYDHYWTNPLFFEELPELNPDLLIISLGTNESYDRNFTEAHFSKYVDSTLSKIERILPHMAILLVTPSENYKIREGAPVWNEHVAVVNSVLREQAEKHGCALWDMERAMGGKGSMLTWKANGLVNKDYVHFLRPGYELQGKLLAEAILNSCLY
jgi:lysophospholipase L1-like esterase